MLLCFAFKGQAVAEEVHPVVVAEEEHSLARQEVVEETEVRIHPVAAEEGEVEAHTLVRPAVEEAGLHICPVVEGVGAELNRHPDPEGEAATAVAYSLPVRQVAVVQALRQQN
jgi:hypothetical protein